MRSSSCLLVEAQQGVFQQAGGIRSNNLAVIVKWPILDLFVAVSQLRMPGPRPCYCSDSCAKEGERAKTRARVGRLRERQKNREEKA
jgi:hypothetical protein